MPSTQVSSRAQGEPFFPMGIEGHQEGGENQSGPKGGSRQFRHELASPHRLDVSHRLIVATEHQKKASDDFLLMTLPSRP